MIITTIESVPGKEIKEAGKTAEEKIKFSEETSGKGGKVIWQIKITVQRRLICHQLRKSTLPN